MRQLTAYEWCESFIERALRPAYGSESIPFPGVVEMLCISPTYLRAILKQNEIKFDDENIYAIWCFEV